MEGATSKKGKEMNRGLSAKSALSYSSSYYVIRFLFICYGGRFNLTNVPMHADITVVQLAVNKFYEGDYSP